MKSLFVVLFSLLSISISAQEYVPDKRMRVIIDNDFGGDPDGLFQLAHHLLSPSVEICGIIGSPLTPEAGFDNGGNSAEKACQKARELMALMGVGQDIPAVEDGASLIVREAMRNDDRPLYVVCGAGLGSIAEAWRQRPEIAQRLTLVWIGGQEYEGTALPPPGGSKCEYNVALNIKAVQTVFNESALRLWQVPRNAYRQCIFSLAELQREVAPCGELGKYLTNALTSLMEGMKQWTKMGEVYVLGDSPLVLLTALQTGWEADAASSDYIVRKAPRIADDGTYLPNEQGRDIRIYTRLDTRLMFEDMIAKFKQYER